MRFLNNADHIILIEVKYLSINDIFNSNPKITIREPLLT